jgi:hypothetical protein
MKSMKSMKTMKTINNIINNIINEVESQHYCRDLILTDDGIKQLTALSGDRVTATRIINNPTENQPVQVRMSKYCITALTSSQGNELYEEQLSKILGIRNILTKHGWDGHDDVNNIPYEYKPIKISPEKNPLTGHASINDDSMGKINKCILSKDAILIMAVIDKDTSKFIAIYKFSMSILNNDRIAHFNKICSKNNKASNKIQTRQCYGLTINKCIKLSIEHNEQYYKLMY